MGSSPATTWNAARVRLAFAHLCHCAWPMVAHGADRCMSHKGDSCGRRTVPSHHMKEVLLFKKRNKNYPLPAACVVTAALCGSETDARHHCQGCGTGCRGFASVFWCGRAVARRWGRGFFKMSAWRFGREGTHPPSPPSHTMYVPRSAEQSSPVHCRLAPHLQRLLASCFLACECGRLLACARGSCVCGRSFAGRKVADAGRAAGLGVRERRWPQRWPAPLHPRLLPRHCLPTGP
jgi:hypothetical protein